MTTRRAGPWRRVFGDDIDQWFRAAPPGTGALIGTRGGSTEAAALWNREGGGTVEGWYIANPNNNPRGVMLDESWTREDVDEMLRGCGWELESDHLSWCLNPHAGLCPVAGDTVEALFEGEWVRVGLIGAEGGLVEVRLNGLQRVAFGYRGSAYDNPDYGVIIQGSSMRACDPETVAQRAALLAAVDDLASSLEGM